MDQAIQRSAGQPRPVLDAEKPAVGVSAEHVDRDALAREVFRALGGGHTVLVAYEDLETIEQLGIPDSAGVIPIPSSGERSKEFPLETLTEAARSYGFSSLIYHTGAEPIDYEATAKRVGTDDGDYVTRAAVASEPQEQRLGTVAAIPAYNEGSTIESVVLETAQHVDKVFVIDDGSDDDTVARAQTTGATIIEHEENQGYGAALKTAFRTAAENGAEQLVVLDGDGQHNPKDIPRLLGEQRGSDAEIAVGSRFLGDTGTEMPAYRRVGLGAINVLTNLSLGVIRRRSWVSDTQSGFRAYGERAIGTLANDDTIGDQMNASTDILYHAHHQGHDINEVGIKINYDVEECSSQHPLVHGVVLLRNILRTTERERPITLIGVPGFALVVLGFVAGYGTVANLASTGTVPFVSAFLAALFVLLGVLACFTSLVLHSINTHLYPLERRRRGGSSSG